MEMLKLEFNNKKIFGIVFLLLLALFILPNVSAKDFVIHNSTNESQEYFSVNGTTGNVSITNTGFFGRIGSSASRIVKGWFTDLDVSGIFNVGTQTATNLWVTNNATIGKNLSVDTNVLFVDAESDKVGIGTATPNEKLEVAGNIVLSSNADRDIYVNDNDNRLKLYVGTVDTDKARVEIYGSSHSSNADDLAIAAGNGGDILFGEDTGSFQNRMTILTGGNVGIGTTSPNTPLEVYDSDNVLLTLNSSDPNAVIYLLDNGTTQYSAFKRIADDLAILENGGNVGIGTTSPDQILHIRDTQPIIHLEPTDDTKGGYLWMNNSAGGVYVGGAGSTTGHLISGGLAYAGVLKTTNAYPIQLATDNIARLTILPTSGNVGIGTTTPAELLEIKGSGATLLINGTDSSDTEVYLRNSNVGNTYFKLDRSATNRRGEFEILTDGVNKWSFGVSDSDEAGDGSEFYIGENTGGDSPAIWIESGGNVGIGTSSPSYKLQVTGGDIKIDNNEQILQADSGGTVRNLIYLNSDDIYRFGSNIYSNLSSGNVGIGDTTPTSKLDIYTATDMTGGYASQIYNAYSGSAAGSKGLLVRGGANSASGVILEAQDWSGNTDFKIYGDGEAYFNNNVGIGTTTPQNSLNVLGDANVTGTLYAEGGGTMTGQFDYNGGWTSDGLSIIDGDIYAQTGFFYNITSLNVSNLDINGSLLPAVGFDNTFDIGSETLRWRDFYLGGDANISGTVYRNNKPLIDWSEATNGTLYEADDVWTLVDNSTFANIDEPLWTANYTAYNDTWTTTDAEIWSLVANDTFVPYTGANANVVLGNNNLSVGGTDFFVNNNDGRVGIGTSSPDTSLHIKQTSASIKLERFGTANDGSWSEAITQTGAANTGSLYWTPSESTADFVIRDSSSANKFYLNTSSGNLGLGTSSPTGQLEIKSSSRSKIGVGVTDTDGSNAVLLYLASGGHGQMNVYNAAGANPSVISGDGNSYLMGGNVGIGTSSPDTSFHIDGGTDASISDGSGYFLIGDKDSTNIVMDNNEIMARNNAAVASLNFNPDGGNISFHSNQGTDYNLIIEDTGDVGIGTLNPTGKLTVNETPGSHASAPTIALGDGDTGFYESADDTIKVSLGGVNPFDFEGYTIKNGGSTGRTSIYFANPAVTTPNYAFSSDENTGMYWMSADNLGFSTGGTNRLTIDSSGEVGIGDTSPVVQLEIQSDSNGIPATTGTTQTNASMRLGNEETGAILDMGLYGGNGAWFQTTHESDLSSTYPLLFNPNGGNVGIGTTSPQGHLDINTETAETTNLVINGEASQDKFLKIRFKENSEGAGADAYEIFMGSVENTKGTLGTFNSAGTQKDALTWDTSGNVGIGTTSPDTQIHIANATDAYLTLESTSASVSEEVAIKYQNFNTATNFWWAGLNQADDYSIAYGSTFSAANTKFNIQDGGNVGINTTTPQNTLNVLGDANVTGTLYAGTISADTIESDFTVGSVIYSDSSGDLTEDNSDFYWNDSTNKLGLGTNNPLYGKIQIKHATEGAAEGLGFYNGTGSTFRIYRENDVGYITRAGVNDRGIAIASDGDVGIGTVSPSSILHVQDATPIFRIDSSTSNAAGTLEFYDSVSAGVSGGLTATNNAGNDATTWFRGASSGVDQIGILADNSIRFTTNSAEAMRIIDGDVGIGTTSPSNTLELNSTSPQIRLTDSDASGSPYAKISGVLGNIYLQADEGDAIANSKLDFRVDGVTRMLINESGNVGIGTSSPGTDIVGTYDYPSTVTALQVDGNNYGRIISRGSVSAGLDLIDSGAATDKKWLQFNSNDGMAKFLSYSDTGSVVSDNILVMNQTSGNVGIGTTSPNKELTLSDGTDEYDFDVNGNLLGMFTVTTDGSDDQAIRIDAGAGGASSTRGAYIQLDGNEASNTGKVILQSGNVAGAGVLFRKSGGTDAMFMDKDGLFGIGTSTPTNLLNVLGDANVTGTLYAGTLEATTQSVTDLWVSNNATIGKNLSVGGDSLFVDAESDKVGIGTTSPDGTLHVQSATAGSVSPDAIADEVTIEGTGNSGLSILTPDGNYGSVLFGSPSDNRGANILWRYSDTTFSLGTHTSGGIVSINSGASTNAITIDGSQNVGIGTTSPSQSLHVVGVDANYFISQFEGQRDDDAVGIFINNNATTSSGAASALYFGHNDIAGAKIVSTREENFGESANRTDNLGLYVRKDGTYDEVMRLSSDGNVGIGTTSPTAGFKLHVSDNVAGGAFTKLENLDNTANSYSTLQFSIGSSGTSVADIKAIRPSADNSVLRFRTEGSGSVADRMTIDSTGNVGIGTTSPETKLDVLGTADVGIKSIYGIAKIESTDSHLDMVSSSDGSWGSSINLIEGAGASNTNVWSIARQTTGGSGDSSLRFNFGTTNSHANDNMFTIDSAGQVGIGTTTPQNLLNIVNTTGHSAINITAGASKSASLRLINDAQDWDLNTQTTDNFAIYDQTNGKQPFTIEPNTASNTLYLDSAGKVGIGTTSPDELLHVEASSGHARIQIEGASGSDGQLVFADGGVDQWLLYSDTSDGDKFKFNNGGVALTIQPDGNIGINDTAPDNLFTISDGGENTILEIEAADTTYDPLLLFNVKGISNWVMGVDNSDSDKFKIAPSTALTTPSLTIDTSGKVGIGTDGPLELLHINSSSGDARMTLEAPSGSDAEIKFYNAGAVNYAIGHDDGTDNFVIGTTNVDSPLVSIDKSGNVGIGTNSPEENLHVADLDTAASTIKIGAGATNNYYGRLEFLGNTTGSGATLGYIPFINKRSGAEVISATIESAHFSTGSDDKAYLAFATHDGSSLAERMRITQDGEIGIGTSSPNANMEIEDGGTSNEVLLKITQDDQNPYGLTIGNDAFSTTDYEGLSFNVQNSGLGYIDARGTSAEMAFRTGATPTEAIRIDSSQNVGIGTTSPKTQIQIGNDYNRGEKSVSLTSSWTTVLNFTLSTNHRSANVKIWVGGNDWSSHSAPNYRAEMMIIDGAGGYGEPGYVTSEQRTFATNDIFQTQLVHGGGDSVLIQMKTYDSGGDGFSGSVSSTTQDLTYEIDGGNFDSIA